MSRDGQDTPVRPPLPGSMAVVFHVPVPPVLGPGPIRRLPRPSTATQPSYAQETAFSGVVPSMFVFCQALAPPAGLVEVRTLPALSTATHSASGGAEGQKMAMRL